MSQRNERRIRTWAATLVAVTGTATAGRRWAMERLTRNATGLAAFFTALAMAVVSSQTALAQCEEVKLIAPGGAHQDEIGRGVAISGNTIMIGAPGDDERGDGAGAVYVFQLDAGEWRFQQKLTPSDAIAQHRFGESIGLDGDVAVIGARGDQDVAPWSGAMYVFRRSGSDWLQEAKLKASDAGQDHAFGWPVAIRGTWIAAGARSHTANGSASGAVYAYHFDGAEWTGETRLLAFDGAARDEFGASVALSDDRLIVGARFDDDWCDGDCKSGSVYVFRLDGSRWLHEQKLWADAPLPDGNFGTAVSIDGVQLAVGAKGENDQAGAAYTFDYDGSSWEPQGRLVGSDLGQDYSFGSSIVVADGHIIVGAPRAGQRGFLAGAAYLFQRDGPEWRERTVILPEDGAAEDMFGQAVALLGDLGVIGSFNDDVANNNERSGSAYVFLFSDPCDVNCDGLVNAFDIEPFLDLLFDPDAEPCKDCAGDANGDGNIDAFDIEPFLECLFGP